MIQVQLKLRPTKAQERLFLRTLWHLTGVYNWAIKTVEHEPRLSEYELKARLNGHSTRLGIRVTVLYGTVSTAHNAWERCFHKLGRRPRLKGRRNKLSSIAISHGNRVRIRGSRAVLPGLSTVRFHKQDIPEGRVGTARIVHRASGWYLCLFIHAEPQPIAPVADGHIGIDPGFAHLITLSTGEHVAHPRELQQTEQRLGQAQRGNRKRQTARLLERQANQRKDRNHKLSRRFVAENAFIAWSKDNSRAIARTMGKSVASAAHSQLRQFLAYKSRAGGREYVEVSNRYSTMTCAACGARTGPTGYAGLSVRQWQCACGADHDRDCNAAVNTLLVGRGMRHERRRETASGIAI